MAISPFKVHVPEAHLTDLKERLARTRFPDEIVNSAWTYGFDSGYLRSLRDYWMNRFDWRRQEQDWGGLPHFQAEIQGLKIHFIHVRGAGKRPLPIIVTHGWPGSFLEMARLIPLLANPQQFGGDPDDSFDVIVPSLPGFGFSGRPSTPGWNTFKIAEVWTELMRQLGYEKFVAQGGDFGANVSTVLAWKYPQRVVAFHLNYIPGSFFPFVDASAPMNEEENAFLASVERWIDEKGAYWHLQRTQPQTVAAALNDSPMGLAAWLIDKYRDWADCDGDVERRFTKDELLAHVTLYWLTETIGSSMRLYLESSKAPLHFAKGERVAVPCGVARFPKEEPMPPRCWAERVYNIQRWTKMPRGGHFAAWEEPELLAQDLREFFRPFRTLRTT
jgi:pimeloyl-ACP methyl ester carboxylesterase